MQFHFFSFFFLNGSRVMECWIYHCSYCVDSMPIARKYTKMKCYLSFKAVARKHVEDLTRDFG